MKPVVRLLLVGLGAGALTLGAQTTYTDNFSTNSGYWEADVTALGGAFVRNGVLNFTDAGLSTSQTSYAYRDFSLPASASGNWQVQVDLTLAVPSPAIGQFTMWSLYASALTSATPEDYVVMELNQNYMQTGWRILNTTQYTNGSTVDSANLGSLTPGTIALQIAYNAAAQTLTLGYDADGPANSYVFTPLDTADISAWAVTASDQFGFRLQGSNSTNAFVAPALLAGESQADNFSLTVAAVPEPAAATVLLGAVVLLVASRRRAG